MKLRKTLAAISIGAAAFSLAACGSGNGVGGKTLDDATKAEVNRIAQVNGFPGASYLGVSSQMDDSGFSFNKRYDFSSKFGNCSIVLAWDNSSHNLYYKDDQFVLASPITTYNELAQNAQSLDKADCIGG